MTMTSSMGQPLFKRTYMSVLNVSASVDALEAMDDVL
jgi:hypothetical protein